MLSSVVTLFWRAWKAEGEEISSAGIASVKLGRRVSFVGVKTDLRGARDFLDLGVGEGAGVGSVPSAIKKFLSSLRS